MTDETDYDPKPWTIKNVPADVRDAATRMAKKDGIQIGEWLSAAIREKIKADRQKGKAVVAGSTGGPALDLTAVGQVVEMTRALSEAGITPNKRTAAAAQALLNQAITAVRRGQTIATTGQTDTANGHTDSEVGQTDDPV